MLSAGQIIGAFRLVRSLEHDDWPWTSPFPTWEARNGAGTRVALKVYAVAHPVRPEIALRHAARLVADGRAPRSSHRARVVDAGFDDHVRKLWVATEFLDGETVRAMLAREGRLPRDPALMRVGEIADALADAFHGGPSFDNMMVVRPDARLVMWDFGLGPFFREAHDAVAGTYTNGGQVRIHRHIAPEEARGLGATRATDVWSLATLAYELLVGRPYFQTRIGEDSPMDVLMEAMTPMTEPPSARAGDVELPAGFDAWFLRCADPEPARRFPDPLAAARALVEG